MPRFIIFLLASLVLGLTSGCITQLNSERAPGTNLATLHTFHVVKLPADGRGIERLIADRFNLMGRQATYGTQAEMPANTQALITYQDRWMWDITMYMLELNIQVRHPTNNAALATGHSLRTSLARKSPEDMVHEVLSDMLKTP